MKLFLIIWLAGCCIAAIHLFIAVINRYDERRGLH